MKIKKYTELLHKQNAFFSESYYNFECRTLYYRSMEKSRDKNVFA